MEARRNLHLGMTNKSGGWRASPLPPAWRRIRRGILARDRGICQQCGRPGSEIDHRISPAQGGTDDPDNLQTLCRPCHATKTAQQANQARWSRPRPAPPPAPKHPGEH